MKKLMAD